MAVEYVPTTREMESAYVCDSLGAGIDEAEARRQFSRWLAAHDAETAARAWDEAVSAMRYEDGTPVELVANVTPYREGDPT